MPKKRTTVISFSHDSRALLLRESVLRNEGYHVVSVASESEARFEIEMGRCGFLLLCGRAHPEITRGLTLLFKKNCLQGTIIFVRDRTSESVPQEVDYVVQESEGPQAIVEVMRSDPQSSSKAS